MRADGQLPQQPQDRAIWQRSRDADAAEDEAERFLDLAGFADSRLDAEDSARVAEMLARDPGAAADIAAVRAQAAQPGTSVPDTVFARAAALIGPAEPASGAVIPFPVRQAPRLQRFARWGSLAAAIVLAAWLGFDLGSGASISLTRNGVQSDDGFLRELLDPSSGFLRDLTEGART
jgi:anti-sigma factor RsiW